MMRKRMGIKRLIPSEGQEQRALIQWINYHPIVRNYYLKIPNEGKRSLANGWNLKQEGLLPGASDLFIFYPTESFHGLFLEMKRNKEYTASERKTKSWIAQQQFLDTVRSAGYAGIIAFGWEHGKQIIEDYLLT